MNGNFCYKKYRKYTLQERMEVKLSFILTHLILLHFSLNLLLCVIFKFY